ncbi:3,4-dihydroxy-2-butanone-4-phosphate synthase [Pigmentiphaga sp. NML080357]|uniref:bifunctional 3,4-dihydroxy-2-butanone-4-phosphate synthase/GTP cyclohydrolase II n=1 Tax=Pigmentiphaga sp. NML080357 TaxID=2008675 RepID=UPI000B41879C|nr:bifunctional 3,4-dihydroxy-2-butanone-4-phosphate synthase/GTP cyclohydrolase II [Pigmentiphaga sp. NML080357]OVZ57381.1 3,4-dihydroxy-2-butanone-4-phosphate synthase [Pigmentiphaga sp. NML080357]
MSAFISPVPAPGGSSAISSVPEIVAELRAGRMVILVDEEDRENEGDLVMAAEFVTPEAINFMARYGRGLICLTLTEDRCRQLNLPLMVSANGTKHGTNFTVSIEAAQGVTTGISAADRARTVQAAVARDAKPSDLVQPGHIFPLKAARGGVLARAGHTEAGCDLTAMAGLTPASVICEVLKDDGSMARLPDLIEFSRQHDIKIGTIADLIQYRSEHESLVQRVAERPIRTAYGTFRAVMYRDTPSGAPHLALVHGDIRQDRETLVRVHEPTSLLDVLEVAKSTHSWSVPSALEAISQAEAGVVILLNCDGTACDLVAEFQQLIDQDRSGAACGDAPPRMDLRTYGVGAQILKDLNVGNMKLLARPIRMPSMTGFSLTVTGYDAGHEQPPTKDGAPS